MHAIILAAGAGRRLAPAGWSQPKCLLPCPGGTLLTRAVRELHRVGVGEVTIVVGFERDSIAAAVRETPAPCHLIVNEDFASTNTIHSLYLARHRLDDSVLILNADLWFTRAVLDSLLSHDGPGLSVDRRPCGDEEVKVVLDEQNRVVRIGKALPPGDCQAESVGLVFIRRDAGAALADALARFNETLGRRDLFYEAALDAILDRHSFLGVPIEPGSAIEIDTPEDHARAKSLWARWS